MRQNARICVHFAFSGKSNSFDPIYPLYQAKHNKFEVSAWELNDPNSAEGKVYFIQPWLKPGDKNRHKEAQNDDSNLPDGYGIKDITAEYHTHNVPLGGFYIHLYTTLFCFCVAKYYLCGVKL